MKISFSVVIPLFNKGLYVCKTIESVIRQTYPYFEVVVVDDGSTDNSVDLIRQNFNDDRIVILEKKNGGPSTARNKGIFESKNNWILLLDADDMLMPNALEIFKEKIESNPDYKYFVGNFYSMVSSDNIKLGSKRQYEGHVYNPFFLEASRELTETSGTAVFEKSILLEELFNEDLRRYEDAERQYRLMRRYPIYLFPTPVSIINREAASASKPRQFICEDFLGHLQFSGKGFWEQMCLYILAVECKWSYPLEAKKLYSKVYQRMDLKLMYLFLMMRKKILIIWRERISHEKYCKIEDLLYIKKNDDVKL